MAVTINGSGVVTGLASGNAGVGKILQVVSTAKADTFTHTGTSFTEVTGLTVTITPSLATSKVLVIASVSGQRSNANNAVGAFTVFRGASNMIVPTSPGNRTPAYISGVQGSDADLESYHYTFLDSPATTSATTYAIRCRNAGGTEVTYVNRTEADTDNAAYGRGVSTITVMEVAA